MGLGSKLKTLFVDGDRASASPPRKAARRASVQPDHSQLPASIGKARSRSWSASNSRRIPAAELSKQDRETPVALKAAALNAPGEDTHARPGAPAPVDTSTGDTALPSPHTSNLRLSVDHEHAHPLEHGAAVDQDTLLLTPVIHETVCVFEIEEVTHQIERHRHVHHVQHHTMPIRLTEEVEIVERGGFLYAHTDAAHAHEDFIRLKALVGEHEDVMTHTPKTSALLDDGTLVHRREHIHVHRIVRPLTVACVEEALCDERRTEKNMGFLGGRGMGCAEQVSVYEVCAYDDDGEDGRAFAEVGELVVRDLADARGARGRVLV